MTSGGVLSAFDSPLDAEFSIDEVTAPKHWLPKCTAAPTPRPAPPQVTAMVDEAHRAKRVVAAHCHGKPGIISAIEGGVTTIEHGSFMNSTLAVQVSDRSREPDWLRNRTRTFTTLSQSKDKGWRFKPLTP